MLANVYRRPPAVALPFLLPRGIQARKYAAQKTARTVRSALQQSTTKPSPTSQVKNRTLPSSAYAGSSTRGQAAAAAPEIDEKAFAKVRMEERMREMEESGDQLEMVRLSHAAGMDPWASKSALMDLRIPQKIKSFGALKDNILNNFQNMLSMYRLAYEFAFPGIVTKWRLSPQLFRTKSTSEKAWVAPYRRELLDVYKGINQAIASGDKKTLNRLTAYEYQTHAYQLLQRNLTRSRQTGLTCHWSLHSLLSPVRILSLRAYPLYSAPEEPKYGNRNVVQALVRFESLQTLTLKDAKGRIVKPDGSAVNKEWNPEPKRVLEYLVCENKMFYADGWYVRDQMFEDIKPKFSATGF